MSTWLTTFRNKGLIVIKREGCKNDGVWKRLKNVLFVRKRSQDLYVACMRVEPRKLVQTGSKLDSNQSARARKTMRHCQNEEMQRVI